MPAEMPPNFDGRDFRMAENTKRPAQVEYTIDKDGNLSEDCLEKLSATPEGRDAVNIYHLLSDNDPMRQYLLEKANMLEKSGKDAKIDWKNPGAYSGQLNVDKLDKQVGPWVFCRDEKSPYHEQLTKIVKNITEKYNAKNLSLGQKDILNQKAMRIEGTMFELSLVGLTDAFRDKDSKAATTILDDMIRIRAGIGAQKTYAESLK